MEANMEKELRLDKYLADMNVGTRSEVKIYIRKCRVSVNGEVIRDVGFKVSLDDCVEFDGQQIGYTAKEYIMLHKPAGVITATADKKQDTVFSYLSDAKRKDLFPVGRLDKDTEGLLLITNDGALAHELLSPKKHVDKVYYAKVEGFVTRKEIALFAAGIPIEDDLVCMPAKLEILKIGEISEVLLTICEGKFHQVKRMFEAVGKKVVYLKRLSMGSLVLDENLKPGEYRNLTAKELEELILCADKKRTENDEGCKDSRDYRITASFVPSQKLQEMLRGKKAILFDLDGTLVDSMWMWREIDIEYLGRFGITLPEDLQDRIAGMSFVETAKYFKEHFPSITDSMDEMKLQWNLMAQDKYRNEVPLKPYVYEFLTMLRTMGIKTGIATSNSAELLKETLEGLKVSHLFDAVHTACEVEHGKPSPDIYLYVADRLGVKPEECLVFEDIKVGIMAGKNAGMQVCAVKDEYSQKEEEQKKQLAEYFIDGYKELLGPETR